MKNVTPMHFDDLIEVSYSPEQNFTLLKYARDHQRQYKWSELTDSMDKAYYCTMIEIIRKLEQPVPFLSIEEDHNYLFNYVELAVLNRFVKIIQIHIGEENDDQRFFQSIAQNLHDLL